MLIFLGIVLFILLIVVHEFGHFIAAKRGGVDVEEFGVGFPPKAKTLAKKNGTEYTLNWLPFGGFVRLKGEHDDATEKGSYGAASMKTKIKIIVAGVLMNLVTAYFLLLVLAVFGLPKLNLQDLPFYNKEQYTVKSDEHVTKSVVKVQFVTEGSPAENAGIKAQDDILEINGQPMRTVEDVRNAGEKNIDQEISIKIRHEGRVEEKRFKLNTSEKAQEQGAIGVVPGVAQISRYTWSAPIVAGGVMYQYSELTFKGLGYTFSNLFKGNTQEAKSSVGGPVATVDAIVNSSNQGINNLILLIALISLSLGIMNILPIPALDGGRLFLTLFYTYVLKRKLTKEVEEKVHGWGMLVLLGLIVLISFFDIQRIIGR
jgi:regulator of sigma E protease